ncbi:MAG: sigma 54-interacting transcriptional regulator [Burkholderiales bacterium]|nr:sigma 54-interacting transcriptional regulator [Burkholderiales bacterium]
MRLSKDGYAAIPVESGAEALARLDVSNVDLVLTDLRMTGMDGLALFDEVARRHAGLPVIIMTAHGNVPDAVTATRRGVFAFVQKPFEAAAMLAEVERALASSGFVAGADEAWRAEIVTRSPAMAALLREAKLVAGTDASVLIHGKSGTGKELLARALHRASARAGGPFIAVNCGAMPEQLLESELFGHVKGAFTGAARDHDGLFRAADGGTLLLDEIGDMPLSLQVKLLRAVQERRVRPVGAVQDLAVDVRLITATHRDLEAEVRAGRFREDLYYRVNVVTLGLPTLAERREDIPVLATRFLRGVASRYGRPVRGFSPDSMELLMAAPWPGNVRQLHNAIEKAVALCTEPIVPTALMERILATPVEPLTSLDTAKQAFERDYVVQLLKQTRGNVTEAARLAQRNRSEFYALLRRHSLDPKQFKDTDR